MAAVNSVQSGFHLPSTGLAPPRVLMCSASMGAEGSVTLQLREAVQAPESNNSLDTALTIGYPDPEILADVLGTLQAAALNNNAGTAINNSTTSSNILGSKNQSVSSPSNSSANSSNLCSNISNNNQASSSSSSSSSNSSSCSESSVPVPNPPITVKKQRPKTSSPTRHGPQQCQVCSKVFGNASALAKHKLTHSDERKYVCAMCSKAFKRQDHLNGHMLTHRNKKPYECKAEGCGKSYCDARSLRRHTENHHSSLAMTPTTPNQSLSSSTGPPTGLSLSPATASGDASSPHGATCIQYISNGDTTNSKPSSPGSPGNSGNEGLTRQQLDLISQIMQQTKQANAQVTVSSNPNGLKNQQQAQQQQQRPRTWNMQTQLQQQNQTKLSPTTVESVAPTAIQQNGNSNGGNHSLQQQQQQQQQQNNSIDHQQQQFHQQAQHQITHALNIVKVEQKPVECNLCHRKFKNVPALNGHMRLHGGYFKKDTETKKCEKKDNPGPPLQTASIGVRALIEEKIISKRSKDLKGAFVVPAPPTTSVRRVNEGEAFITPKTPISVSVTSTPCGTTTSNTATTTVKSTIQIQKQTLQKISMGSVSTATQSSNTENKDATLIELLKRGTKIAVKRTCSDPGQIYNTSAPTVTLPSDVSISAPTTPNPTPPLAISLPGDSTPMSLTISQAQNNSGDVFTLTYSTDSSTTFFGENDVYSVSDTAMLLQAVDSIQLLNDSTTADQIDEIASLSDYSLGGDTTHVIDNNNLTREYTPSSKQLEAVLNSPLPDNLAEFSALHSKDYVLYNCTSSTSPATQSSTSPLPSPLAYPTPPASHEAVAQASPFLDDSHHFSDANVFFDDKGNANFIDDHSSQFYKDHSDTNLTENEKILKLKNELFNEGRNVLEDSDNLFKNEDSTSDVFDSPVKVEDLLNDTNNQQCDLKSFNHQNLSFLDATQNFLDDSRNPTSPLSESFFNSPITSAEEVKEVLKDVLPAEALTGDTNCGNDIDLYYLPGLGLQSQMMPNSDDPLLSSSPKDFIQRVQQQQYQQSHSQQTIKTDSNSLFNINNIRKLNSSDNHSNVGIILGNNHQTQKDTNEHIINLPNNSINNNSNLNQPMKFQPVSSHTSSLLKRRLRNATPKKVELYQSKLRKPSTTHYTPSPILNPDRKAPGLYSNLPKSLIQENVDLDDEFDDASALVAFLDDSKVNIGTAYQAAIPSIENNYNGKSEVYEELMWDPSVAHDEKLLTRFIELSKSSAVPLGFHSEEVALKALLEAQGDTHVAVLSLLQAPSSSVHFKWMPHEIELFLRGIEKYGKDFYTISKEVITKSTSDCVQLYYFWKKLCADYKITHLKQEPSDMDDHNQSNSSHSETKPHVCEMPDCSASFTSRAALHGHTRIHCIGRSTNHLGINHTVGHTSSIIGQTIKDDFPCKVCGKVFNKVKSRSAHMKSHRPQENDSNPL